MKRIEEELRQIRQQMEEDFLLHSERMTAQQQSIMKVESALGTVETAVVSVARAVDSLRSDFRDFALTTRANQDTWLVERKRTMRMLDVVQSGLLTRLEKNSA